MRGVIAYLFQNVHWPKKIFSSLAERASVAAGSAAAFFLAAFSIVIGAITGPIFHYSAVWQLVINTVTNIITFLLVFLIQNSQNRETRAVQLKLDELIRATQGAHNMMMKLENVTDKEVQVLHEHYAQMARNAREQIKHGESDQGAPELKIDPS